MFVVLLSIVLFNLLARKTRVKIDVPPPPKISGNQQIWSRDQAFNHGNPPFFFPQMSLNFRRFFFILLLLNVIALFGFLTTSCGPQPATPMEILSSCNPIWVTYRFGLHRKTLEACMIGLALLRLYVCMIIGHIENSPRLPSSHLTSNPGGGSWIPSMNFKCQFSLFHNRIHTSSSLSQTS